MKLLCCVILILGTFAVVYGSECVPATAECIRYWVKIEPHKNLMESVRELNSWCRQQKVFYKCLEDIFMGKTGNLSYLPTNLLISKMFADDLCLDGSHSRMRYLSNAACINQLNTEYCTRPEYFDIVTTDDSVPPSRCSISEKTFSCIAATMIMNCGFDAGRVYRYLLKLTKYGDEICEVESSDGVPPCKDTEKADGGSKAKLSGLYYDSVRRFGDVNELPPSPSDDVVYDYVSGAIRSVLDAIQDSPVEESYEDSEHHSTQIENAQSPAQDSDAAVEQDEDYRKTPIITEPFTGLLHYNYSGREFAMYWRQPEGLTIAVATCEHLLPSYLTGVIFGCTLYPRFRPLDCVPSPEDKDEKLTPELIRDIDPDVPEDSTIEFGPSPYWMEVINEYKRQKELREQSTAAQFTGTTESPDLTRTTTPSPPCGSRPNVLDMVHDLDSEWWKCPHVFSEELRREMITVFLPDMTEESLPLMSGYRFNNVGYVYFYNSEFHIYETVDCSKVNECHPRGRGVYKCVIKPRKNETCRNCYVETTEPHTVSESVRVLRTLQSGFNASDETSTEVFEGSGSVEDETSSDELITLLLGAGEEAVSSERSDAEMYTEDIVAEDDLVSIDVSSDLRESKIGVSPEVSFVFLEQDSKEPSDLSYEALNRGGNQDRSVYELSSEHDDYGLLDKNVFVLQAIPSSNDEEDAYAVVDVPEEEISKEDLLQYARYRVN